MLANNQRYVTIDTETESLNLHFARPWSVAIVLAKGENVFYKKEIFVDVPGLNLPQRLRVMCNFNQGAYDKGKVSPLDAWNEVSTYLFDPQYRIIGQNFLNYDVFILGVLQRMAGKKPEYTFLNRVLDTLAFGKAYKEGLTKPSGDVFSWQMKILNDRSLRKRANQKQLLKDFNISFDENMLHNSLYDSERCFELFLALKKRFKL